MSEEARLGNRNYVLEPVGSIRSTLRSPHEAPRQGMRLRVGPIEATDGTPVVDVKAVLDDLLNE